MTIIQKLKAELAECHRLREAENRMTGETITRARGFEARAKTAEAAVERSKATFVPQRNVIEMLERLGKAGYGKPGTPNTLWAMVMAACGDVERLTVELATEQRAHKATSDSFTYDRD